MTRVARPSENGAVRTRARVMLGLLGGLLGGCNLNLPSERDVEDLRVLDLKVDPPEIGLFEGGSLALDPMMPPPFLRTEVRVRALVAHPDLDARFGYRWVRCKPGLGNIPCEEELGETREVLGEGTTPEFGYVPVDLVVADALSGQTPLDALAQRFVEDPRDLLNGLYTYINVEASVTQAAVAVDTPVLQAVKRVVVFEPRLVAQAIQAAQKLEPGQVPMVEGLGLPTLCVGVPEEQAQRLYTFLSTRTPNLAPTYARVEARIAGTSSTATVSIGLGQVLELEPGDALIMRGRAGEGDAEKYQLIDANCVLQKFEERLAYSWFTQAGELDRNVTTDEDPVLVWQAPLADELPESGELRARVWSVLRDGRGGSDHRWFDIHVSAR